MIQIADVNPDFVTLLPETWALIRGSNLVVHESVEQVFIAGSRGLAGGYRADSDVDLSLKVEAQQLPEHEPEKGQFLRDVLDTTLNHWRGAVELDLAAVFDTFDCCGLRCFQTTYYDSQIIQNRGIDCFGIYKIQRGFDGYVKQGVQLARLYPLLRIWHR